MFQRVKRVFENYLTLDYYLPLIYPPCDERIYTRTQILFVKAIGPMYRLFLLCALYVHADVYQFIKVAYQNV